MKRTREIIIDDGETKIAIRIKFQRKVEYDSQAVNGIFENIVDAVVATLGERFHYRDMKIGRERK